MSGRERLRRGWLRFGKVGRKPNKDGKNRLCLEKNRCREEEEFPVVKGISKRVIVVKSPDPKIFEQAIFIIREGFCRSVRRERKGRAARSARRGEQLSRRRKTNDRQALCPAACAALCRGGRHRRGHRVVCPASGASLKNRSRSLLTGSDFFGCAMRGGMIR